MAARVLCSLAVASGLMLLLWPNSASAADRHRCEEEESALRSSAQGYGWTEEQIEAYVQENSASCWAKVEAEEEAEREAAKEAESEAAKEAEREAAKEAEREAAKEAELEATMEAELEAAREAAYWQICPGPASWTGTILVHDVGCVPARKVIARVLAKSQTELRVSVSVVGYTCHLRRHRRPIMCRHGEQWILSPPRP